MSLKLEEFIREVMDFPKPGIGFKDITPLLLNGTAFKKAVDDIAEAIKGKQIDKIVSIESRGFIFGAGLAYKLGCGQVIIRKEGKLPYQTLTENYELEYGMDTVEMHIDAIRKGEKILIIDDLLATGGTALATAKLVEKAGGVVVAIAFVIELAFLEGAKKLKDYELISLIKYE